MSQPEIFTEEKGNQVASLGEVALIQRIRHIFKECYPPDMQGPFDDAALLPREGADALITADPVIYGMHFDGDTSPSLVGRKLMNRNISDIAAMGGQPTKALLTLILPPKSSIAWLDEFLGGIASAALEHNVQIVGGDVSSGREDWAATLTLLGRVISRPVPRTGVSPGDLLWVTGELGGSLLSGRHLSFTPRVPEGLWLAEQLQVKTLMDLSDGLGKDLPAMLENSADALLDEENIPISTAAREAAKKSGHEALYHAFNDGEDYELLFTTGGTVEPEKFAEFWAEKFPATKLTLIGEVISAGAGKRPGKIIFRQNTETFGWKGYEHLC